MINVYCALHSLFFVPQHRVHYLKLVTVPVTLDSLEDALKLIFVDKAILFGVDCVEKIKHVW